MRVNRSHRLKPYSEPMKTTQEEDSCQFSLNKLNIRTYSLRDRPNKKPVTSSQDLSIENIDRDIERMSAALVEGDKNAKIPLQVFDQWPLHLLKKIVYLYEHDIGCDVVLKFSTGQEIRAHQLILAASTNLISNLLLSRNVHHEIMMPPHLQNFQAVKTVIQFIYSGRLQLPENQVDVRSVWSASNALGLEFLSSYLMRQFPSMVGIDSLPDTVAVCFEDDKPRKRRGLVGPKLVSTRCSEPLVRVTNSAESYLMLTNSQRVAQADRLARISKPEEMPRPTRFECDESEMLSLSDESCHTVGTINSESMSNFEFMHQEVHSKIGETESSGNQIWWDEPTSVLDDISTGCKKNESDRHFSSEEVALKSILVKESPKQGNGKRVSFPQSPIESNITTAITKTQIVTSELPNLTNNKCKTVLNDTEIVSRLIERFPHIVSEGKKVKLKIIRRSREQNSAIRSSNNKLNIKKLINRRLKSRLSMSQNMADPRPMKECEPLAAANPVSRTLYMVPPMKSITTSSTPGNGCPSSTFLVQQNVLSFGHERSDIQKQATGDQQISSIEMQPSQKKTNKTCFCCHLCPPQDLPITFSNLVAYQQHLQTCHTGPSEHVHHSCPSCGFHTQRKRCLLLHQYVEHSISPPRNICFPKCDICDEVMLDKQVLLKHRMQHTLGSTHNYSCTTCAADFCSFGALQGHSRTRLCLNKTSSASSHRCPICLLQFTRSYNLKLHLRIVHKADRNGRIKDDVVSENRTSGSSSELDRLIKDTLSDAGSEYPATSSEVKDEVKMASSSCDISVKSNINNRIFDFTTNPDTTNKSFDSLVDPSGPSTLSVQMMDSSGPPFVQQASLPLFQEMSLQPVFTSAGTAMYSVNLVPSESSSLLSSSTLNSSLMAPQWTYVYHVGPPAEAAAIVSQSINVEMATCQSTHNVAAFNANLGHG